jgi:SecD/SecF fusion protein
MMKIMDKTNIDFIRPRYYFIAGSVVVITLGLLTFWVNRHRLFNIDFTGGTLVTIQLNDDSPKIKGLSEAARASYVRTTASKVLPDATVETLNVGTEKRGVRFNVRTTDETVKHVQTQILEAFRETLAKLDIKVSSPTPIPAAKPAAPAEKEKEKAKTAAPSAAPESRFPGGSHFELAFSRHVDPATVQAALFTDLKKAKIPNPEARVEVLAAPLPAGADPATSPTRIEINTDLDANDAKKALETVAASLQSNPDLMFDRLENFGGAVAGETRNLALLAVVASWLIIIAYVWFRFKSLAYGVAAVLALVHDVLITIGAVAISPYKIDLPMVAAFLTLIGFSVNDTIVIFDRIREIKGKTHYLSNEIVNAAVNQTMSRTILTSLTAWIVVVILYLFGGEGLEGFSFCLVVGFLSGTYSTVYIASPILIDWLGAPHGAKARSLVGAREV